MRMRAVPLYQLVFCATVLFPLDLYLRISSMIFSIPEMKKKLLSSAPWRVEEEDKFKDANISVTSQPGDTSIMYVPGKKSISSKSSKEKESLSEIDPELKYSFHRNFKFLQQVFTIDTVVKPLPPTMAKIVSRNLSFFTSIFTQFLDPRGISDIQKSLGLGQEEKKRRVRD